MSTNRAEELDREQLLRLSERLRNLAESMSADDAEAPERERGIAAIAPKIIASYGAIIGPATLAVTGMLFLSGWAYRRTLDSFGISSSGIDYSIQYTLALGYVPLVSGAVVVALILLLTRVMDKVTSFIINGLLSMVRAKRTREEMAIFFHMAARVNRVTYIGTCILFFLTLAYGSGLLFGLTRESEIRRTVESGCLSDCFDYVIQGNVVVGRLVAQDTALAAIYTQSGLRLVKTSEILLVVEHRP